MSKRIAFVVAASAATVGLGLVGTGGIASAAHCDRSGPGNSAFAAHVQEATHDEGFHRGWSSCIPGNPNFNFTRS
jgi:hypothetical protein